jgi:hypothetical protein
MRPFAFTLILMTVASFAQTSETFTDRQVSIAYPGSYASIQRVNFRNFTFHTFNDDIPLKNGRYKLDEPLNHFAAQLESRHYLGKSIPKRESVLVLLSWFAVGGSSSQGGIAQVFTLTDGHLLLVQDMDWDTQFDAGQPTVSFDANTKTLVIRTAHYIPGDAHCCVSATDVISLRWNGANFIQTDIQTELSQYGKREGKTLPH